MTDSSATTQPEQASENTAGATFRIRPTLNSMRYPEFSLEEIVSGFMKRKKWVECARSSPFYPEWDQSYDAWVEESIDALRKKHRKILDARGIRFTHMKHPIIYLPDAPAVSPDSNTRK